MITRRDDEAPDSTRTVRGMVRLRPYSGMIARQTEAAPPNV